MRDGKVADERYFNGATAESLLNTRSVTKTVTAMLVGAAIADGRLAGVSAPVAPVLGPDRDWADIRIVDLLTMSSALDCNDSDPNSPGNEENMYPLQDWHAWARRVPLDPGYARDAQGRGPLRYCTAGVMLLAQLLETATGEKVERYADARLFKPLCIGNLNWSRSPCDARASSSCAAGPSTRLRCAQASRPRPLRVPNDPHRGIPPGRAGHRAARVRAGAAEEEPG